MELQDAKCPNCGGQLKVNPKMEKGECIYCHSQIIIEEAIQKFKGEVDGIATTKNSMIRAYQLIEDGDYDKAAKLFQHVIETNPTNADAYFGMFNCEIKVAEYYRWLNMQMERSTPQYYNDLADAITKYGKRAIQYADEPDKSEYETYVNQYIKRIEEYQVGLKQKSSIEGCYIATAVYGSYDAPEVITLRIFRDEFLKKFFLGRLFIKTYYFFSPPIANKLKNAKKINEKVRLLLDKFVDTLKNRYHY